MPEFHVEPLALGVARQALAADVHGARFRRPRDRTHEPRIGRDALAVGGLARIADRARLVFSGEESIGEAGPNRLLVLAARTDDEVVVETAGGGRVTLTASVAETVSVAADPSPPARTALPEQLVIGTEKYGR